MNKPFSTDAPHHVLTVLNDKYLRFGCLLLHSLLASVSPSRIASVLVCDVGLSAASRAKLQLQYPNVMFMKSTYSVPNTTGVHSRDWALAVLHKTVAVRRALEIGHHPLLLLDADQFVCGDFVRDLDPRPLFSVTERRNPPVRRDGLKLPYIASTMRFRDAGAIAFVDEWIATINRRMRDRIGQAFETPALCEVLSSDDCRWTFGTLPDTRFSAPNLYVDAVTQVVHFKSIGPDEGRDFFHERIALLRGDTTAIRHRLDQAILLSEAIASADSPRASGQ